MHCVISVIYYKRVPCPISYTTIVRLIRLVSRYEKKVVGELEVTIVSEKEIQALNKHYRGKDTVTDVLSFAANEASKGWFVNREVPPELGQIYICFAQIKRQAREYHISPRHEFIRMVIHGVLHVVGYDHIKENDRKKMFSLQEKLVLLARGRRGHVSPEIFRNLE